LPENAGTSQPAVTETNDAAGGTGGDRYVINPTVSRFTVKVFATGLLSAFGHSPTIAIRDMQGEVRFNPLDVAQSSMHFAVRADSLTVAENVSDKDRREMENEMRERVLEVTKYPQIVYDAPRVSVKNTGEGQNDIVLLGQLTLRGVTRAQPLPAKIAVTGGLLRAFGEFSLRQSDYNIKPVSAVGGALKVKDEVKLAFDIVARKDG
jgi:polyisoprenoid-binding protein YceI